ncbi:MAG: hypothetical protein ACREC0_12995 [Methylocella sp.]
MKTPEYGIAREVAARGGIDGQDLDHLGSPGFQIDRAAMAGTRIFAASRAYSPHL